MRALQATGLAACALLPGCRVAEARAWNLDQIHESESRHRYVAALEYEFEWVLRHRVAGLFQGTGARFAQKDPSVVEAPSDECFQNLAALAEIETNDPDVVALQVEWCARLSVEDPAALSRECAVRGLAKLGRRMNAGLPARLGSDQVAATPEELAPKLAEVVAAARRVLEGESAEQAKLAAACDALRVSPLDLAGARRVLKVTAGLLRQLGRDADRTAPLHALVDDLQRVCIRRALAQGLEDRAAIVRAAAVESVVAVGGRTALDALALERMQREDDARVVVAVLRAVTAAGLPEDGGRHASRAQWLDAIYTLVAQRPEGELRVAAMLALESLTNAGVNSLREEDWQAWNEARVAASAAGDVPR